MTGSTSPTETGRGSNQNPGQNSGQNGGQRANHNGGQNPNTNVGSAGGTHGRADSEAEKHSEGPVARNIEHYTAQMPSDWFLWAAGASVLGSLTLRCLGDKDGSQFVGQWVAPFMLLGVYNKIVKVAGSDRVHKS